jgi:hypothetical protein
LLVEILDEPHYANMIREDLDCLLEVGFITLIRLMKWLSPIVIVPKKNGKLCICVDYRQLNFLTKKDPYPLPFIDKVLDLVVGK